jgi:hypothetical protein
VWSPALHPRGVGGRFAVKGAPAKGSPAKAAPATPAASRAPAPNGLGYSAARWRQLQALEAAAKSGRKLDAHQEHELHVAHDKRLAADGIIQVTPKKAPKAPKAKTRK